MTFPRQLRPALFYYRTSCTYRYNRLKRLLLVPMFDRLLALLMLLLQYFIILLFLWGKNIAVQNAPEKSHWLSML